MSEVNTAALREHLYDLSNRLYDDGDEYDAFRPIMEAVGLLAEMEAFADQAVLDMRRKDGLIEAAEAALGEAMTLLRDIQADRSWRSNDNTLWPRIVAITRTSKEPTHD